MKTLTIAVALLVSATISTRALGDAEQFTFDLRGHEEVALQVNVLHGGIVVRGHDHDQVLINAAFEEATVQDAEPDDSGVRSLPNLGEDLKAHRDGGTVIVRAGSEGRAVQLAIQVPRHAHLRLTVRQGGDIRVSGVAGEMELQNSWGRIDIEDISNSVVAHAHSDDVTARFAVTDLPGPCAFSSWSGDVELSFPDGINTGLRWRSNYGEILSEFDVHNLRTVSVRDETADSARVEGFTVGSINGGGPEISATSYSGNVEFRRAGSVSPADTPSQYPSQ